MLYDSFENCTFVARIFFFGFVLIFGAQNHKDLNTNRMKINCKCHFMLFMYVCVCICVCVCLKEELLYNAIIIICSIINFGINTAILGDQVLWIEIVNCHTVAIEFTLLIYVSTVCVTVYGYKIPLSTVWLLCHCSITKQSITILFFFMFFF